MRNKLSGSDKQRIELAISALERRTAAELAVVIAHRSHDYAVYPFLWAAGSALLAGGIFAVAVVGASGIDVVLVEGAVFIVAYLAVHWSPLGFALIPRAVKRDHAHRLARAEFTALVEQRTEDRLGVLLFVSVAERHVEILADRAVRGKIPLEHWRSAIDRFRSAAKTRTVADGLLTAVEDCALLLERHFPPATHPRDMIPNRITEI